MVFEFTSAIRYNKSFLVDGHIANDTMYTCPDEGFGCPGTTATNYVTCGCPFTEWVECAFNYTVNQNQKINFLSCWDDSTIVPEDTPTNASNLQAMAQACAVEASIDWDKVAACHDGPQKSELLWIAGNKFMDKWPDYSIMGGHYHVPHVLLSSASDVTDVMDMENISLQSSDIPYFNARLCSLGLNLPACMLINTTNNTDIAV